MKTTTLLKELSYKHSLWIISNTSNEQIKSLKSKFDFFQNFDGIITSESTGSPKPNISIFVHALRNANASPSESIFIDDSLKNIQSADSLGINTHHYENYYKLKKFLEEYA